VQIGMGENILIQAFVVIIIGGIGSIRGAFVGALIVGMIDTIGRAFLPDVARLFLSSYSAGSSLGPALSSMMIYMLMAAVLVFRPEGLFPAARR
jgi:branched-chain amino acid transport system permease protein